MFALAAILFIRIVAASKSDPKFPYRLRPSIFTHAEVAFYHVLRQATGDRATVFGQVRVADVLKVEGGMSNSERQSAFNKISRKHFDFVLCKPDDLSILCAIELDDKSHNKPERQERDRFLNEACKAAGLRLIRIKAQRTYDTDQVRYLVDNILAGS